MAPWLPETSYPCPDRNAASRSIAHSLFVTAAGLTTSDNGTHFDTASQIELGKRLADALGDNRVLIMSNHGVLVVGPTIAEAYTDLYQLERACMIQCHAQAMGRVRPIPHQVARDTPTEIDNTGYKLAHFAAMRRLLDVEQPDYVN